mmetsp:Transcript_9009/g.30401  ORF Transcript_9009/g.30401 Transcript_9009/m.30401 type:complete len:225 (+) Transcript_9009:1110-1784(+)
MLNVQVELVHVDVPLAVRDVVVRTILQNVLVPPLDIGNVIQRCDRPGRARTACCTRSLADGNEIRIHRRFLFKLLQVFHVTLFAQLSRFDFLRLIFTKLHAQTVHVGFFLENTIFDKLKRRARFTRPGYNLCHSRIIKVVSPESRHLSLRFSLCLRKSIRALLLQVNPERRRVNNLGRVHQLSPFVNFPPLRVQTQRHRPHARRRRLGHIANFPTRLRRLQLRR